MLKAFTFAAAIAVALSIVACGATAPQPNQTPTPANTPRPTYTPYPTFTPAPTPTTAPTPQSVIERQPSTATTDQRVIQRTATFGTPTATPLPVHDGGQNENFYGEAHENLMSATQHFANRDYNAAIASYKAAQLHHGRPSFVLESRIGLSYQQLRQYPKAIEHFSNAMAIRETTANRTNRAIAYMANRQCAPAITDARRALELPPNTSATYSSDGEANMVLAACYYRQGQYPKALQHADAYLAIASELQGKEYRVADANKIRNAILRALSGQTPTP